MRGREPGALTPEQQARLRARGLLAEPQDRWEHPSGTFHLERLPHAIEAARRQRSDRPTRRLRNRGPISSSTPTINLKENAA